MKKIEAYVKILKGSLTMEDKNKFFEAVRSLPDGLYNLVLEFIYDNRTSPQNRYYWGVVIKAYRLGKGEFDGEPCSKNQAHYDLQLKFNYIEKADLETGELVKEPKGTSDLDTGPFVDYTELCRNWIAKWMGIDTPDPDKGYKKHLQDWKDSQSKTPDPE